MNKTTLEWTIESEALFVSPDSNLLHARFRSPSVYRGQTTLMIGDAVKVEHVGQMEHDGGGGGAKGRGHLASWG